MSNRERERIHCRTVQAVLYRSKANPRLRFLLCVLATWADDAAQCHPSVDQIACLAGLTTRHVQAMLGQLVASGELTIAYNASDYGTNVYTILCALPAYKPQALPKVHPVKKQGEQIASKTSPEVKQESPSNSVPVPDPVSLLEVKNKPEGRESEPPPAPAVLKLKFGEMGNVLMSRDERSRLETTMGGVLAEAYIRRLDFHMASRGVRYVSHYATIVIWWEKDQRNSTGGNGNGIQQWESAAERRARKNRETLERVRARDCGTTS